MIAKKSQKSGKNRDFASEFYQEIEQIKQKFQLDEQELISLLSKKCSPERIPLCIFNSKLSSFEAIVKYLRENCELNFREIGELLERSQYTISSSYRQAKAKSPALFEIKISQYDLPTSVIAERKYSVLESIVKYLKEKFNLKFSQISRLLNLHQKTVWTVYQRAKRKDVSK
ncbi:MAG: hypothetical protein ABIA37_04875 [Candidatus Woesearchaeota archaeon]